MLIATGPQLHGNALMVQTQPMNLSGQNQASMRRTGYAQTTSHNHASSLGKSFDFNKYRKDGSSGTVNASLKSGNLLSGMQLAPSSGFQLANNGE